MRSIKKKSVHQCQCRSCESAPRSAEAKEHQAINQVISLLHEKGRRQFAGLLALQWGRGGLERLHVITGLSHPVLFSNIVTPPVREHRTPYPYLTARC
jgi:hypothetical protein